MIMLIHPETGAVETIKWGDPLKRQLFERAVLDGFNPVGPESQVAADIIRRRGAPRKDNR